MTEDSPITRNHLAVALAYESALLTEERACRLMGFDTDVVGFRGRMAYLRAEVAKLNQPGGLPNYAAEGLRPRTWD